MITVYIGLGANLSDPATQLDTACNALQHNEDIVNFRISSYYRSIPMGDIEQPDYINAVACFDTQLPAEQLLDLLQYIELQQGRERLQHWGPRTLDLDLLLYGKQLINTPRLIVPHYGLKEREFVLIPLHELTPDLTLPCGKKLNELITPEMTAKLNIYPSN